MKSQVHNTAGLITAFLAGQAVMFGLVVLLRPLPAGAQAAPVGDPGVVTARAVIVRDDPNGAGMQLSSAGGEPRLSFFDGAGNNRLQLSVSAKGKPTVIFRNKAGAVALGVGLDNETPTIGVLTADGKMVTLPLPKESTPAKP